MVQKMVPDIYSDCDVKLNSKSLNISSNDNSRDSSIINASSSGGLTMKTTESNLIISNVDDEAEGLTLTSMVKNLNEDFKKRKNLEKKEKKKLDQKSEKKKGFDEEDKKRKILKKIAKKEEIQKKSPNSKYSLAKSSSSSSIASRINSFEVKNVFFIFHSSFEKY